jgi:uncharacterized protein YndB with AHSA1/START domain
MSVHSEMAVAPLIRTVTVPTTPERAFRLFTAGMSEWWPLATHSIGEDRARRVEFGAGVGGKIVEYDDTGEAGLWGTVVAWQPPELFVLDWHPGNPPEQATTVTVRFTAVDGGTLVELTHSNWHRRPDGSTARSRYADGWGITLAAFAATAS